MRYRYIHSILGGTFDQFHIGHQTLIDTAFAQSERVTIGITKPVLYQHKLLFDQIDEYKNREQGVVSYLKERNFFRRATIISIDDIYGDSLEKNIDAIFATHANLPNVRLINKKRMDLGLSTLKVVIVPTVRGADGQIITSQRIRLGEIDRKGNSYLTVFRNKIRLELPENLRDAMRHPLGEVKKDVFSIKSILAKKQIIIAVGDIVALSLLKMNQQAAVSIIDQKTRRHGISKEEIVQLLVSQNIQRLNNKPAMIHTRAVKGIKKAIKEYLIKKQPQVLFIRGEEDLLALPAILLAPLGALVLYGQFDLGVVINEVTQEKKDEVKKILEKFKQK